MEEAALQQDDLALELSSHLEFVRRLARVLVRDEQVAEDVVQETMLAAIRSRPNPSSGLRVWLKSVLRRRVLLHFRTEQRRSAREALRIRDAGEDAAVQQDQSALAAANLDRTSLVGNAVASLKDPYRTVVILRYFEGLPPKAIATRLNRPIDTVNTQLQRGIQRLRAILDERHGGDRRAWVCAILPQALHGRDGWWPRSVQSVAGFSYGSVAVCGILLVLASAVLRWSWESQAKGSEVQTTAARAGTAKPVREPNTMDSEAPAGLAVTATGRTSATSSAPVSIEEGRGGLLLAVRSGVGVVPGARVTAIPTVGDPQHVRTSSSVKGASGLSLKVSTSSTRSHLDALAELSSEAVTEKTGDDGVAIIDVLDGRPWEVRVEAEGLATSTFSIRSNARRLERSVLLHQGSRVLFDRGSFPLEYNLYMCMDDSRGFLTHDAVIPAGTQEVEVNGVEPGLYQVEALSAGGVEVSQWNLQMQVQSGRLSRLDLSMGGHGRAIVDVRSSDSGPTPHFVHVSGHKGRHGLPVWNQFAPVHSGLARFEGLPPGEAVVRVFSGESEIGRTAFEVEQGGSPTSVPVDVARGRLDILHRGEDGADLKMTLTAQTHRPGSTNGWLLVGVPIPGLDVSRYYGLPPGAYKLWINRKGLLYVQDVELQESVLQVDMSRDETASPRVGEVNVTRGNGLAPKPTIQVEIGPNEWTSVDFDGDRLRLSYGEHVLRCTLDGLGFSTCRITVPNDRVVTFEEPAPPRPIHFRFPQIDEECQVTVRLKARPPKTRTIRSTSFLLDSAGSGTVELREGIYEVTDRFGRVGEFTVLASSADISVSLN